MGGEIYSSRKGKTYVIYIRVSNTQRRTANIIRCSLLVFTVLYDFTLNTEIHTRRVQRNLGVLTPMEKYNLALAA